MHDAIPMIMGSNIGTSVTNTIVSLTQVRPPARSFQEINLAVCVMLEVISVTQITHIVPPLDFTNTYDEMNK